MSKGYGKRRNKLRQHDRGADRGEKGQAWVRKQARKAAQVARIRPRL